MKAIVFLLTRRRGWRTTVLTLALAGLAIVATAPAIAAESHVEASCESGQVGSDTTSDAGAAALNGTQFPWGVRASASEMTLSGTTSVTDSVRVNRFCEALSRFTTTVTVEPGTSGLSGGDPVTLRVSVGLQGGLYAAVGPLGGDFSADAHVNASLRLTVPERIVCAPEDGQDVCRPAELAQFGAEGRHWVEGALANAGFPGFATSRYQWGWSLEGDRGDWYGDQDARTLQDCPWPGPFPCTIVNQDPSVPQPTDYRGLRQILVDAVVGDRIELNGALTVFAQALDGSAQAHFSGPSGGEGQVYPLQMSAGLTPGPGFEGLTLRSELAPPPDDEPEPTPDTEAPTLTVPADLTTNATSAAGAVVTYVVTATDNVPEGLEVDCSKPSGSAFPNGTTTVTCTATDAAGNSTTREFAVVVVDAAGQVLELIDKTRQFLGLPALSPGLKATLADVFQAVVARRKTAACTGLRVYELAVRVLPGRALTPAERSELLADASRIRSVIGCT
jgi:hypothetical protein